MIRKRYQNVPTSRHKSPGLLLGLLLVGFWLLPTHSQAQDVAFSLSQQVVGDTLEVTLSGQSLDAQPDALTAVVLNFDASACLDASQAYVTLTDASLQGVYDQHLVTTASGFKLVLLRKAGFGEAITLNSTNQSVAQLRLPFNALNCTSPSVSLSATADQRVTNHLFQLLSIQ